LSRASPQRRRHKCRRRNTLNQSSPLHATYLTRMGATVRLNRNRISSRNLQFLPWPPRIFSVCNVLPFFPRDHSGACLISTSRFTSFSGYFFPARTIATLRPVILRERSPTSKRTLKIDANVLHFTLSTPLNPAALEKDAASWQILSVTLVPEISYPSSRTATKTRFWVAYPCRLCKGRSFNLRIWCVALTYS
jgi:hypothetical protein